MGSFRVRTYDAIYRAHIVVYPGPEKSRRTYRTLPRPFPPHPCPCNGVKGSVVCSAHAVLTHEIVANKIEEFPFYLIDDSARNGKLGNEATTLSTQSYLRYAAGSGRP